MKKVFLLKLKQLRFNHLINIFSFFAKLTGIKEATKAAMIGGNIVRVNAKIGDYVKDRQVIVEFDTDNPSVQYNQAKTTFENAEKNYTRVKALYDAGETSLANYDGVETQYRVAKEIMNHYTKCFLLKSPF